MYAGNVTWRGRSVQCCTCSKWVHLKCLLLSFSTFRTLGSSHSWSFPPCGVPAFGDFTPIKTVISSSDSSSLYISTAQSGPLYANAALLPHPRLQSFIPFPLTLYVLPHHDFILLAVSFDLLLPFLLHDSIRVLQWNASGLRTRSTELLHFISSHPVDLTCIQKFNLNLSSSFRISEFSSLRSDRTHSRSDIFPTDVTHTSGGDIIFVKQGLSSLNFLLPLFLRLTPTMIT